VALPFVLPHARWNVSHGGGVVMRRILEHKTSQVFMLMMFASLTWAEDVPTMDHAHMDHSKMNHGDMKMQEAEIPEKKHRRWIIAK
jgi:hypothetical protein